MSKILAELKAVKKMNTQTSKPKVKIRWMGLTANERINT